jgi:hypothetical protein
VAFLPEAVLILFLFLSPPVFWAWTAPARARNALSVAAVNIFFLAFMDVLGGCVFLNCVSLSAID